MEKKNTRKETRERPKEIVVTLDFETGKIKRVQTKSGKLLHNCTKKSVPDKNAKLVTAIEYRENEDTCVPGEKRCCRWWDNICILTC